MTAQPTVSVQVTKIYRADVIAFRVTIENRSDEVLPAGLRVQVVGRKGRDERPWFTVTSPDPLGPGERFEHDSSGPMYEDEADREFVARLIG